MHIHNYTCTYVYMYMCRSQTCTMYIYVLVFVRVCGTFSRQVSAVGTRQVFGGSSGDLMMIKSKLHVHVHVALLRHWLGAHDT